MGSIKVLNNETNQLLLIQTIDVISIYYTYIHTYIYRMACPVHNSTLQTLDWSRMNAYHISIPCNFIIFNSYLFPLLCFTFWNFTVFNSYLFPFLCFTFWNFIVFNSFIFPLLCFTFFNFIVFNSYLFSLFFFTFCNKSKLESTPVFYFVLSLWKS